jgi:hypothetical protein
MQELVEYGPNLLITEVLSSLSPINTKVRSSLARRRKKTAVLSIILTVYLFKKWLDAFILG